MPNLSDLKIESRILITLDSCLLKMAGKLNTSFDPDVPESVKLLKEFRATMATRRQWAKRIYSGGFTRNLPVKTGSHRQSPIDP